MKRIYQYQRVADDLRVRLAAGEFEIGEQLPGISDLQEHYGIASLNTVRQAQQILVGEGLLRSEQGRGVFVVRYPDLDSIPDTDRQSAAITAIDQAIRQLTTARAALTGPGEFYTPHGVIQNMVELLLGNSPDRSAPVSDPAAGTGGFLLAAYHHLLGAELASEVERHLIERAARPEVRQALTETLTEKLGQAR